MPDIVPPPRAGPDPHRTPHEDRAQGPVAVLGAAGFLGGAVVRRLDGDGREVSSYTRQVPFLDGGSLSPGVEGAATVFWLVSSIRPATTSLEGRADADRTQLAGLLAGLERSGSTARVVAVSSGGTVYDTSTPPPYDERHPTRPANDYGAAMLEIERTLRERWENHVVVRASNVYGPGQPARRGQGVLAHWLDSIRGQEPIHVLGDPSVRRDYVYVDDLVDGLLAVARHPDPPRVVNAGSGVGTSLGDLADAVVAAVDVPVEVERSPGRTFDAPSTWLDVALAREVLGWEARTSLQAGIVRTWQALGPGVSGPGR